MSNDSSEGEVSKLYISKFFELANNKSDSSLNFYLKKINLKGLSIFRHLSILGIASFVMDTSSA